MKTFKEFLNERSSPVSKVVLPKVTKQQLRDMILNGEDINTVDYSDVSDMSWMFQECSSLVEIPHLDTSKVTEMRWMFEGCSSLKEIPHLDTSKVTDMRYMFNGCSRLEYLPNPLQFKDYSWSKIKHPKIYQNYPELFEESK